MSRNIVVGVESKLAVSNFEVEFNFKKSGSGKIGASILQNKVSEHN